ncbi:unnamed protein product [Penicillium roqueforti FM164]|uniref:Uncharacterized protein n=1 Tax=Penicillium roqueforti (strain FM164) TaxID=1365484 RepID=W6QLF5_PENRF|nr:unnamed protein product [Penicillium roqueforti FM164]
MDHVARISQQNSQNDESDVEAGDLDGQQAYMLVYLQVPHQGTEFFPPNERAKQAAARGHCEVEAIKAFHKQYSTITPALLGIKEDVQDQQGVIPGGFAIHFVFQRVPGYRLWEDHVMPKHRAQPHRFFTDFTVPERDQIRESFNKGYRELNKLGWVPYYPSATKLIWDPIASKLYFVDFRDVH